MNYPELDIISKTKIRGMLAFLKHSEILVPYVHGNDPVKLQLSPTVPNFQILREKHDLFMFKYVLVVAHTSLLLLPISYRMVRVCQISRSKPRCDSETSSRTSFMGAVQKSLRRRWKTASHKSVYR